MSTHFGQPKYVKNQLTMIKIVFIKINMSTESFNRTSEIIETPSYISKTPKRVDVGVLKQRLLEEKKKEKVKRTIILSSVVVSLGALTLLTY